MAKPLRRPPLFAWLPLLLTLAVLAGCGDGKIRRYPVTGKVLVGGKPVEGARVIFCPIGGDEKFQKERPFGVTDQNGDFTLTTFQKSDGAPAGDYNIMIRNGRPKTKEEADRRARGPRVAKQYGKPDTSGVTATVEPTENTLPPFELEAAEAGRRR